MNNEQLILNFINNDYNYFKAHKKNYHNHNKTLSIKYNEGTSDLTLYSYGEEIGIKNENNEIYYIDKTAKTDNFYSMTTSKHCGKYLELLNNRSIDYFNF